MDHAHDIAWTLARAYAEEQPRSRVLEPRGDRDKASFPLIRQAGWFRITVEEINAEDLTEEELMERPGIQDATANRLSARISSSASAG